MPHETPLISTIVVGLASPSFSARSLSGSGSRRSSATCSPVSHVGPHTPGFVADQPLANELAEIGVILLMFGVGLHFSLKELWSVRAIAIPGAIVQIGVATLSAWRSARSSVGRSAPASSSA